MFNLKLIKYKHIFIKNKIKNVKKDKNSIIIEKCYYFSYFNHEYLFNGRTRENCANYEFIKFWLLKRVPLLKLTKYRIIFIGHKFTV